MQLGISSYTYGWAVDKTYSKKPLNEITLAERTAALGLSVLQIGDNLPLHDLSRLAKDSFKKKLIENNITLEIGARGLTEENLKLYRGVCNQFGSIILRFVIDAPGYEPSVIEVINIIKSQLHLLEQCNVTLAIENHDRLKAAEYAAIMNAVNSEYVGICLDTINSLGAGESIAHIIDTLSPFTVNLHLKDFGIARLPHKQGFIADGRIAGQGMLNVPAVIEKLKPFNRCHTAILEQWVSPESDVDATINKEQQWAVESIKYLRQLDLFSF